MKICNIFTIQNQEQYKKENYAMILAHLLEKDLYDPENLFACSHIIMDNGAYENSQVSKDINDLITLVGNHKVIVDEIVIPDVMGDYEKTKQLYKDNYETMLTYKDNFQFMYVVHAKTIEQLHEAIDMVNKEQCLKLVLGIPKHGKLNRTSSKFIRELHMCNVPIHFLGIRESFEELLPVKNIIRSCDSIQLSYIARDCNMQQESLYDYQRVGKVIDLETDYINDTKIDKARIMLNRELKDNGIL